ncbi:hypothetical protein ACNKHS_00020 [Shigella flexneri]
MHQMLFNTDQVIELFLVALAASAARSGAGQAPAGWLKKKRINLRVWYG